MSIYKYQRVVTDGPDGFTLYFRNTETNDAVELAELDGWHYVFAPDSVTLPAQHPEIQWQTVILTDAIKEQIKSASRACHLIDQRVVAQIRDRYSVDDEIKLLRIAPSEETSAWNAYVEDCRAWGRSQKAALGL